MSRLKNLYTHLITNRRAEVDGWLDGYLSITADVAAVRTALERGKSIQDKATYEKTTFKAEAEDNPWLEFATHLIFAETNGVSSRGQSVLSHDNFDRFLGEQDFVDALAEMIKQPNKGSFLLFGEAWERVRQKYSANKNPLLINRTLAACTLDVTSTVNGSNFETVYWWLVQEDILPALTDPAADWYDKNVHLMTFLRAAFADGVGQEQEKPCDQLLSIFVWFLFKNISNPFSLKKQVIKYGAPGTGKTFTAKRDTRLLFEIWREEFGQGTNYTHEGHCEVVQFHPSFGYEDFMEGLRPVLKDGKPHLILQNGVFKRFCIRAGTWETDVHAIPSYGPDLAKRWESLTIQDLIPHQAYLPGDRWHHIFSQSVKYKKIADAVPPFFFVIDEINRAELSRVLGELMICLEYRGVENAISTQYAALNTAETGMISLQCVYKFFIPHNVYVVGTMNTIDRSVESFDLALRRRFRWERIDPDITELQYHLKNRDAQPGNASRPWVGLAADLRNLNDEIRKEETLGSDYEIGHAYLMNLRYPQSFTHNDVRESVWYDAIKPLLEEYLRGSGRSESLIPRFQKAFGLS